MDDAAAIEPAGNAGDAFLRRWLSEQAFADFTRLSRPKAETVRTVFDLLDTCSLLAASLLTTDAITTHARGSTLGVPSLRQTFVLALMGCGIGALARRSLRPRACSLFEPSSAHAIIAGTSSGLAAVVMVGFWILLGPSPDFTSGLTGSAIEDWGLALGIVTSATSAAISLAASLAARAAKVSQLRIVLVGGAEDTASICRTLERIPESACVCVGQLDDRRPRDMERLREWVARRAADAVVLALSESDHSRAGAIIGKLADSALPVCTSLSPFHLIRWRDTACPAALRRPLMQLDLAARQPGFLKRSLDVGVGLLLLLMTAPMLLFIALSIWIESPGPVLFKQWRFGQGNRPFKVWKFRTMRIESLDPTGERRTVAGDDRVTRIGRLLRKTSLDEVPQLFNVLRGEMSLVGPRPHPLHMKVDGSYYFDVIPAYRLRHRVRPGITGLAQVSGSRGEVADLEQAWRRLELDIWYVNHWSLWLDLAIVFRTLRWGILNGGH
jgi:exopolysaccharide biosynthesis polyprenyl glycosylphosphotransferase